MTTAINVLAIFLIIALGSMSVFFVICSSLAQYEIWIKKKNGITLSLRNTSATTSVFLGFVASDIWLVIGNPKEAATLVLLIGSTLSVILLAASYTQLVYYVVTTDD